MMKNVNTVKPVLSGIAHGLSRQRGASLLEGIAYLGIAAIVVLGAVSLLTGAFGSAKSNQMIEEITALRTAVRKLHMGQSYPADAVTVLSNANAIPNTLVVNRGVNPVTMTNSWAGQVTIAATAGNAGRFEITYPNVPREVCMAVVSGANGWFQISNAGGAGAITAFPATTANATALCGNATNTLVFTAT
jgi:hypothetical protein